MSDQNGDERAALVEAGVEAAYRTQGYVDDDGEVSKEKLAEVLAGPIAQAAADSPSGREQVSITREQLMEIGFSEVPGRNAWAEQEDPELAQEVYDRLDTDVWRICDPGPSGQVQIRLNGENAVVLVRRNATRKGRAADVYVTRNRECLMADVLVPQSKAQARRAVQSARLAALLMERVPEHARSFNKELSRGLTSATRQAKDITAATMAAIASGDDGDDDAE